MGIPRGISLLVSGGSWLHQTYHGHFSSYWNSGWHSSDYRQWCYHKETRVKEENLFSYETFCWFLFVRNCNIIVLALCLYSLRLLGYSFIESPMESLIFEVLHDSHLINNISNPFLIDTETIWKFLVNDRGHDLR